MNILATDSDNERRTTGGQGSINLDAITVPEANFDQPEGLLVQLDNASSHTLAHEATICQRANLPWWRRPSPWWCVALHNVFLPARCDQMLPGF